MKKQQITLQRSKYDKWKENDIRCRSITAHKVDEFIEIDSLNKLVNQYNISELYI